MKFKYYLLNIIFLKLNNWIQKDIQTIVINKKIKKISLISVNNYEEKKEDK